MADDSDLEKTESPSPRRLEQAREQGQAPHSRELASFAVMASSCLGLVMLGQGLLHGLRDDLKAALQFDRRLIAHPEWMLQSLQQDSSAAVMRLLPYLGTVFFVGVAVPLAMSGFLFSTKNFLPDFSRLSPAKGLGNMFSSNGLSELVKAVLKAILIGGMAGWFLWRSEGAALALGHVDLEHGIQDGVALLERCMFVLLGGMAVVVAVDVPFQLWRHHTSLMMTREELRQEAREAEGDPHIKARIRQQQREMSRKRMMAAVPTADVVVTNPTHYAVALQYAAGMRAPRVVAKGGDLIALKIRGLAEQHGVPILEQPPLARALFKHADLEREIPPVLYAAVAQVLAYLFQLKSWKEGQGQRPKDPGVVDVPAEVAVPASLSLPSDDGLTASAAADDAASRRRREAQQRVAAEASTAGIAPLGGIASGSVAPIRTRNA